MLLYCISLVDKPNIEDMERFYSQYGVVKFVTGLLYMILEHIGTIVLLSILSLLLLFKGIKDPSSPYN